MTNLVRAAVVVVLGLIGCATAPKSPSGRSELVQQANGTLQEMMNRDPGVRDVLAQSAGYAVFPSVGKGGVIVGGAYGKGVLYQNGQVVGFVKLEQASLGATLGGQTFSELLALRNPNDVEKIKRGQYTVGADASVVALTTGAAASTQLGKNTAVFVLPRGGAMVDVSIAGQRINFVPMG